MRPPEPAEPSARRSRSGQAVSVEDLHQRLREAIEALETGDQWRAWLDFAHRLHPYSFRNLILIWAQRPTATAVASFTTWQSLNRRVCRGEKAIRVMAPITKRVAVTDKDGKPVVGPDGKPEVRSKITGYRPAPVFDIGQTDGPGLPEVPQPQRLAGTSPAGLLEDLVAEVSERGYRLMRGPVHALDGANGVTKVTEREVWVRDDVDDAQAAKTLVHELAHVVLHADPQAGADVPCAGIREVEAESIAHIVLAAHGIDTGMYSFPYVASWAYPLAAVEHVPMADIVARTGDRVMRAAASIIEATVHDADQSTRALTARVAVAANRASELRDQSTAAALPPVERPVLLGVIADSQDFFRRRRPTAGFPPTWQTADSLTPSAPTNWGMRPRDGPTSPTTSAPWATPTTTSKRQAWRHARATATSSTACATGSPFRYVVSRATWSASPHASHRGWLIRARGRSISTRRLQRSSGSRMCCTG